MLIKLLSLTLLTLGQSDGVANPRVAVVNVAEVSERYHRTTDLEARFDAERRKLQQERDALREKIEIARRSLQEELKPGTEAFDNRRKELAMLDAELQWFVETKNAEIEKGLASSLRSIYSDIQSAVQSIAAEKNIDLVLAADQIEQDFPETPGVARQRILLNKVVFWSPRMDITESVISRLNAGYRPPDNSQGAKPMNHQNKEARGREADERVSGAARSSDG